MSGAVTHLDQGPSAVEIGRLLDRAVGLDEDAPDRDALLRDLMGELVLSRADTPADARSLAEWAYALLAEARVAVPGDAPEISELRFAVGVAATLVGRAVEVLEGVTGTQRAAFCHADRFVR